MLLQGGMRKPRVVSMPMWQGGYISHEGLSSRFVQEELVLQARAGPEADAGSRPHARTLVTLHPPKDPEPGARPSYVWNGVTIYKQFARRPRVLRLEASKP